MMMFNKKFDLCDENGEVWHCSQLGGCGRTWRVVNGESVHHISMSRRTKTLQDVRKHLEYLLLNGYFHD